MVELHSNKSRHILILLNGIVLVIFLNLLSSLFFVRFDLTEEKRFSIKDQTKNVLRELDDDVYIEIYLEGDLNADLRRFRKAIAETVEEFRIYSGNKVQFVFIDPATAIGKNAQNEFMQELVSKGIQPKNVIENQNGQRIEKLIFPGVVIGYGQNEIGVNLLKGTSSRYINESIEQIEFELVNAIHKLTHLDRKQIGVVTGHGELNGAKAAGFQTAMTSLYQVKEVILQNDDLSKMDAIIIAKPTRPYTQKEKFVLDQYIMKGGKVLFFIDKLEVSMDSVSQVNYFAFPYNLELEDLLFKYGIRVNNDLIQDFNSGMYPVVVGSQGGRPDMQLMPWPYFALINQFADHVTTRNLDAVVTRFASTLDTVKAPGIRKTPILFTSQYSRKLDAPVKVSLNQIRRSADPSIFTGPSLPIGYLLEGKFTSLFKNRFLPDSVNSSNFIADGNDAKIIVISDGDLLRNEVNPRTNQAQPLGFDPYTNYSFANEDLLMNLLAYVTDENGLIRTRNKEVKIRPLDKKRIADEKVKWQIINIVIPITIMILLGILKYYLRRRRYLVKNESTT